MKVTLNKKIFPKDMDFTESGYSVKQYICNESIKENPLAVDENGDDLFGQTFTANGSFLPNSTSIKYDLQGTWVRDKKYGYTFVVDRCEEIIEQNEVGIIAFLTSGLIKDCGIKVARAIYNTFQEKTIEILDNEPERLLEVPGIKEKRMEKIIISYTSYRGARDIVSALLPLGISSNKAVKVYKKFKNAGIEIIKTNPYELCKINGIGFLTADQIAKSNKLSLDSANRCKAAMMYILEQAETGGPDFINETTGHLCLPYEIWIRKSLDVIRMKNITQKELGQFAKELSIQKEIKVVTSPETKRHFVYRMKTALIEEQIASKIMELIDSHNSEEFDILDEIRIMELETGIKLAPEQANAVITGLVNNFSVITGPPGTGKTTIINFIRKIYKKNNKKANILLAAPTGLAAKKMRENTNSVASTIHKALGLLANEDGAFLETDLVDYDLIIIDETSMLDMFLASALLKAMEKGCKVIFIGDVDQLQSVGPGAFLSEMIESNVIKVAKLTKIYRQEAESTVALNSFLIKNGKSTFDFDENFVFLSASDFTEAAQICQNVYLSEIAGSGIDNVVMLSPFRDKTDSSVYSLNNSVRDKANPPSPNKKEMKIFGKNFREGDKVMQTKNVENIANGDIGYITSLKEATASSEISIKIDFGEDRVVEYDIGDMENIVWSYAQTIHKSQGSEYKVVIINILPGHHKMLKRNLIYTAITRAKTRVYIIGSMEAVKTAIARTETLEERRYTLLAERLRALKNRPKAG